MDPGNYRGIVIGKVFCKILNNRLVKCLDKKGAWHNAFTLEAIAARHTGYGTSMIVNGDCLRFTQTFRLWLPDQFSNYLLPLSRDEYALNRKDWCYIIEEVEVIHVLLLATDA